MSGRPRRVTVFAGDLGPAAVGRWRGGVRLHAVIECLLALDLDVEVMGFGSSEGLGSLKTRMAATHVVPRRPVPASLPDMLRAARAARGELLLAHKLRPLSFGVARMAQSFQRRPLVLDLDDSEIEFARASRGIRPSLSPDGPWRQLEHQRIFRWLEGRTNKAQLLTAASSELAGKFGAHLLRTARDLELFDPRRFDGRKERQRLGLSGDGGDERRILLFAGAPRPYKGLQDLLSALEAWSGAPFHLLVLGGSPYDDYHQQLEARWPQLISVRPAVEPSEVAAYLAAADLVVVPQRDTSITRCQLPLKLLDGMAMARPVLVTRVGDLAEIVGEAGFIAEPADPGSIRRQLERFLDSPEGARRRGELGRERAQRLFSVEVVSRRLSQLLERLDEDG